MNNKQEKRVNMEAVRLVVEAAKQHIHTTERLWDLHGVTPNNDSWDELKTAIWMLEQNIEQYDG